MSGILRNNNCLSPCGSRQSVYFGSCPSHASQVLIASYYSTWSLKLSLPSSQNVASYHVGLRRSVCIYKSRVDTTSPSQACAHLISLLGHGRIGWEVGRYILGGMHHDYGTDTLEWSQCSTQISEFQDFNSAPKLE